MKPNLFFLFLALFGLPFMAQANDTQLETETINGLEIHWQPETTDTVKTILRELVSNMVKIEGGEFTMGSDGIYDGLELYSDETPMHTEKVKDFYLSKYELSQLEWWAVMGEDPESWKIADVYKGPNKPIHTISFEEGLNFIDKLNSITGLSFRLPLEAEWEYAAKGGNYSHGYTFAGSDNLDEVGWYGGNTAFAEFEGHDRGLKVPNELGLYDMSGNVQERVSEGWRNHYDSEPLGGSFHTSRGGDWHNGEEHCRVTARSMSIWPCNVEGLRLAL
ncbi:MAG: formylglycine-generating enzyme family protein [Bacteroidales bacterium]|nr:formylglycine-generating enzyme family protein [Bacteroidales bacterium]